MKKFLITFLLASSTVLALPVASDAAITSALGIECEVQPSGPTAGQRWCGTGDYRQTTDTRSTVESFDGVPIDVNIAFPSTGGDGPYPLVLGFHGYGQGKVAFADMQEWLEKGYAVFSQTNRGFHESCGTALAKAADPDCTTKGFVRLDDTRYEVRDAQLFTGKLVDEGLVDPERIAAIGASYGGGMAMALAALNDRTMMPDDSLVPWKSPEGVPIGLAVSVALATWTDLSYSLMPNGSNLDYIEDSPYFGEFGVMKQTLVYGLYLGGITAPGYYSAPGVEPSADLAGWMDFMNAGEPYEQNRASAILDEIQGHHSSYYIDHSRAPAPLFMANGHTDDLFPASEMTRFYNRTRTQYPDSPLGILMADVGHPRSPNKADVFAEVLSRQSAWVDHYLADVGPDPQSDVTVYTQTCPTSAPSGGPFVSDDWASASPGEIRMVDSGEPQEIAPGGGTPAAAGAFNLVEACSKAPGAKEPGTATYELAPAPASGYTLIGSPTVLADIAQPGDDSQIAARLVDVSPDGSTKTLVARVLWRPGSDGFQVFQLNPGAWEVQAGHVLRLELLPADAGGDSSASLSNYGRPSNQQQKATIKKLELRIPVLETPGSLGGLVTAPAAKVLPPRPGIELARGYGAIGSETLAEYAARRADPTCPVGTTGTPPDCEVDQEPDVVGNLTLVGAVKVKGKSMSMNLKCRGRNDRCRPANITVRSARKFRGMGRPSLAKGRGYRVGSGRTRTVHLKLTAKARALFSGRRGKATRTEAVTRLRAIIRIGNRTPITRTVRRVGRVR
ncbi:MAG: acetylxylan esterase [Solirubrobacterales bacterium]